MAFNPFVNNLSLFELYAHMLSLIFGRVQNAFKHCPPLFPPLPPYIRIPRSSSHNNFMCFLAAAFLHSQTLNSMDQRGVWCGGILWKIATKAENVQKNKRWNYYGLLHFLWFCKRVKCIENLRFTGFGWLWFSGEFICYVCSWVTDGDFCTRYRFSGRGPAKVLSIYKVNKHYFSYMHVNKSF